MPSGSIDPSPLYYDPVTGKFTPIKPLGRGSPKRSKARLRNGSSTRYPSSYSDEDKRERKRRRGRSRKDDALVTRRRARSPKRNSASTSKASGRVKHLSREVQPSPYHHPPSRNLQSPKPFPSSISSNLTASSSGVSVPSSPFSTERRIRETVNDVDPSINSTATSVLDQSASYRSVFPDIPSETSITIASDMVAEAAYPSPSSSCCTYSHPNQTALSLVPRISSHDSNILDRTAPFVALDMPSEIQLNRLPDDSSTIERILVEQRKSINCFIIVAAAYKQKGMPEIAELIGVAGMRLWESKANDHPSLIIPMLLFLASLCVDTAQSQGSAGKGKAYQERAITYLRDFESLDSERWQKFRVVAMADKKSSLHDLISSLPTEFRSKEAEIQSSSVADVPSLATPDLSSMKAELQRERASKRKAEDNHFEAVLSRRRLEDDLVRKEEQIRHLEDEVDRLHAELIVFGAHP